jgi:DNA-binding MarR family transcriptional regulator
MSRHPAHDPSGQPAAMHDAAMLATAGTIYRMAEISRVLRSVTSALEKLMHAASGSNDLTLMHCLVLVHLSRSATCKQVELKSATGIAPAHLTRLVDELVHQGLVGRHRSSWDRRQLNLALTAQGRETALHLLASLKELTDQTQLDAIEHLGSSLEHFVSTTVHDGHLNSNTPAAE